MTWLQRLRADHPPPAHRVAVRKRRPHGIADSLDVALSGRTWSWWCSCDPIPQHAPEQELALAAGMAHLASTHPARSPR